MNYQIESQNNCKRQNRSCTKRDMAMEYATGNIFAFIDDDAYPSRLAKKCF